MNKIFDKEKLNIAMQGLEEELKKLNDTLDKLPYKDRQIAEFNLKKMDERDSDGTN